MFALFYFFQGAMSGIFDPLQKPTGAEVQDDGISLLDLAALPPLLRKIMHFILREHEVSYPIICQWAATLPEGQRPTQVELDQSLGVLSDQLWLIKRGKGKRVRYQVNLRRKAGSKIAQDAWNVLDTMISDSSENNDLPQK